MSRKFAVVRSSYAKKMVVVVRREKARGNTATIAVVAAIFLVRAVAVITGMEAAAAVTLAVVTIDEAMMMEEVAIIRVAAMTTKREAAAMTTKREAAITTTIRTSKRAALTKTPREEMTTEKLVLGTVEIMPLIRAMPEGAKRTGEEEEAMAIATTDEVGRVVREMEARILARGGRRVVNQLRAAARL